MNATAEHPLTPWPPVREHKNRVLPDARFCPHNHACSASGDCGEHPLCTVIEDIGPNVVSLATPEPRTCPYRLSISCGEFCSCPRRYALFMNTGH